MTRHKKAKQSTNLTATHAKRIPAGLFVSIVIALLLGGIPFALGKYIELNSPGPFDSGAYVYSAKHLLDGAKMGVDELPSARPGTLIMNIIGVKLFGYNDIGPKIVQMFLQLAALIFMFFTLRKIFGAVASVVGVTLAAVYLSSPMIAKFGNVKEQFMIAFMIYSACAFLWYAYTQKRYWLILCGFFALQPYYFKPTGMSVVFAIVLYLLISRLLSGKITTLWFELILFLSGFAAGLIVPGSLYLWQNKLPVLLRTFPPVAVLLGVGVLVLGGILIGISTMGQKKDITAIKKIPKWAWGLVFVAVLLVAVITQWNRILAAAGLSGSGYLADSLSARGLSELAPHVFRYYRALSVPIVMALCSIIVAAVVWIRGRLKKSPAQEVQSRVVWMLAVWWLLDMAFIWVSPRSYQQYYLPMCGSAAVLGGYAVWAWQQRLKQSQNKMPWLAGGVAAAVILGCLSIPTFIGQRYSPDTGDDYVKNYGQRRRGFVPDLKELPARQKSSWMAAGNYIRANSSPDDTLYVWGWVPGIYVQAQRLAPIPKSSEGNMHVTPPEVLARQIDALVNTFKEQPPKFIVDTRKRHFPNDRPPLELWPIVPPKMFGNEKGRLLNRNPQEIAAYDAAWKQMLETRIEPNEAERYEAMKPFREFVMNNYKVAGQFGPQIVFERK